MSLEENKAIARRYYDDIFNQGNLAVADEILAPDFVFTVSSYPEPIHGREAFKQQLVMMMRSALPDWHFTVKDMVAQGDRVVGHWIASGTHTGEPLRLTTGIIPANGKRFEIEGMSWFRIVNGKITESLINEDALGMATQLGIPLEASPQSAATQHNGTLASRYFIEVMNQGKLEVVEEIASPDFQLHIPTLPEPMRGREGLKQFAMRVRHGLPDVHFTIERHIVDGDQVAVRWTLTGTHLGEFLGIPPTGRPVTDVGSDLFRIAKGQIVEIRIIENDLALMQQLGVISLP
jgi:steroid delta-isomerase-like uncharacterized protein